MARKYDEAANFVFVQLIEQEPGICDKRHPDYATQGKRDMAWERITLKTRESGYWLTSFETIQASQLKLSEKIGCTQLFIFLILYLNIPLN
jgi:hypothetical protein